MNVANCLHILLIIEKHTGFFEGGGIFGERDFGDVGGSLY